MSASPLSITGNVVIAVKITLNLKIFTHPTNTMNFDWNELESDISRKSTLKPIIGGVLRYYFYCELYCHRGATGDVLIYIVSGYRGMPVGGIDLSYNNTQPLLGVKAISVKRFPS